MTFEEYTALNREERMRARVHDLALVGATQSRVSEPAIRELDSSMDQSAPVAVIGAARAGQLVKTLREGRFGRFQRGKPRTASERNASFSVTIHEISRDTRVGEETVLRIIETYEKSALRD